jgi:hypothetical protein
MILDFNLDFLKDAVALIDPRLEYLDGEIKASPDPDQFGILDQREYLIGFGFVACQTYLTAVLGRGKMSKREAFALGPKHRTGRYMAELMNAAANHWKHSPEWLVDLPTTRSAQTLGAISSLGVDIKGPYPLANTLFEILTPNQARFSNLIPLLKQWRDALPR